MKIENYRNKNNRLSYLMYHFIFCVRYKRRLLEGEVETRFREILEELFKEMEFTDTSIEVYPDHVILRLNALPDISPTQIMAKIKSVTSKRLREEFEHLNHLGSLWHRSFLVTTECDINDLLSKLYLDHQKTRG